MDNKSVNLFLKNIEENTRKVFSSSSYNESYYSSQKNCMPVTFKQRETSDEIQEYATNAINELLGWYGYDKMDSDCTKSLSLGHFTSIPITKNSEMLQINQDIVSNKLTLKSSSLNISNSVFEMSNMSYSNNYLLSLNKQLMTPLSMKTASFGCTSKFPYESYSNSTYSDNISCSWCSRTYTPTYESEKIHSYNMMNSMEYFCSETCFVSSRRTVFKQTKICDWCRHIKNPTSYIDLQDGENQLQFCSNRCLNQYKINIFCHETQTHLMLQDLNNVSFHDTEKDSLITPELWFRSCQSPLNNSTENICSADTHFTSSLCNNRIIKTEQNNTEKLIVSNQKVSKKKKISCIKKYTKATNYNEQKKKFCIEMNENINEHNKETINEKNKYWHYMANKTHYRLNYSKKNDLNYKDSKKEHMMNIINHNSHNHQNNKTFLKKNIYVKDIKNLQEKEYVNSSGNMLKSSYFLNSTSHIINQEIPFLSKSCSNEMKFSQTKDQKQINISSETSPFKQSNQTELFHSLSSKLLSPVTIFVPYSLPIPIPIPIPIPVPISTAIFNKIIDKEDRKKSNYENIECKDSIQNKHSVLNKSQITTNISTEDLQQVTSDKFCFLSSFSQMKSNNEINNNLHQHNLKFLKKKKYSNETINHKNKKIQLKKRNKFITT